MIDVINYSDTFGLIKDSLKTNDQNQYSRTKDMILVKPCAYITHNSV